MSTTSTISLEFADDTIQTVYCHWDGYYSHVGKILKLHYSDPFKLRDLIDLGDVENLNPKIGKKHHRRDDYEVCTFFHRDIGEDFVPARSFKNFNQFVKKVTRSNYNYILRREDRSWYVALGSCGFKLLTDETIRLQHYYR